MIEDKTKAVGVTFDGRQEIIHDINELTDLLIAERQPENPYDENAIHLSVINTNGEKFSVGYINRNLAAKLSPLIDNGESITIKDYFITGSRALGTPLGIIFSYVIR